jgi:hypothetical protein
LEGVFGDRIIKCGLWPAYSPDLTPCDFYLWGNLMDKVYRTNPHTEEELKERIRREILEVSLEELQVNFNLFKRYIYIYIYIERERERECVCVCVCARARTGISFSADLII